MKNVLLVDDDDIFNFLNRKLLEGSGLVHNIHVALNGKEAMDLLNNYYAGSAALPDVIFLDLNMPVMDGFTFLQAFKRVSMDRRAMVKIIVVTSSENPKDMEKALALGADGFMKKPLSEESLLTVLASTVC
jgi:CheY-like chemotaxis protein